MTQPTGRPSQLEPVISFTSILSRVREAYPELPLDPVILQSVLLCLIAGRYDQYHGEGSETHKGKNLLLRTRKDDVGMVLSITAMILNTVFGFPIMKSKIKPREVPKRKSQLSREPIQHPDEFLRSLFFRARRGPRQSYTHDRDVRDSPGKRYSRHGRSLTFPSNASPEIVSPTPTIPPASSSLIRDATDDSLNEVFSISSSRRPLISHPSTSTIKSRPGVPKMQTEPLFTIYSPPLSKGHSPSLSQMSTMTQTSGTMPKAVVVSGLENTELPAQRALNRVLGDRKLVLSGGDMGGQGGPDNEPEMWTFPDDFIFVYVCELQPSDRPEVLRPLVDKFAISVDINISPTTRQLFGNYRSSHSSTPLSASYIGSPRSPFASLSPLSPSSEPPRFFRSPSMGFSSSSGSIGHPAITPSDLAELRRLASPLFIPRNPADDNTSINAHTSIHPSLQLYLSDLFSATRHHPELDGSLITRQAHQDAEDLIQAYRVISGSSLGTELITTIASTLPDLRLSEEMDSDEGESKVDVDSMGWVRDEGGHRVRMSFEEQVNVAVRVHAPDTPMNGTPYLSTNELQEDGQGSHPRGPPDVWDVSEVDIARIFPRIVSHRLSVRSGPEDEILGSIMFPAVGKHPGLSFSDGDGEGHEEESDGHVRKTVKEILVAILADV